MSQRGAKRSSDQVVKEVEDKRVKTVKEMQATSEKTDVGATAGPGPNSTETKSIAPGEIPNVSIKLSFIFQYSNNHYPLNI